MPKIQRAAAGWSGLAVLLLLVLVGVTAARWRSTATGAGPEPQTPSTGDAGDGDPARPVLGWVTGRVLLEDQAAEVDPFPLVPPPAGACRIRAWQSGQPISGVGTCDAEGAYRLAVEPAKDEPFAVEVEVTGRLRAVLPTRWQEQPGGELPTVALGVAETVRGQVLGGSGDPLAGVTVEARPVPDLGELEPWRAVTDEGGAFSFETLPPGPVSLRVSLAEHAPTVVDAIAPEDGVVMVVERLVDLVGRVVGPGALVARARLRLEGSGVWPPREVGTGPDGRFRFERIPDGVYALEAVTEGEDGRSYASLPVENITPETAVSLALIEAQGLQVEVQTPDRSPVAGARVSVSHAQLGLLRRVEVTDAEGRAGIAALVPGRYVVRADGDGWLPADPVEVEVGEGEPEPVVLTLTRAGSIAGEVVDADGRPVAEASIEVASEGLFTLGESQARARLFESAFEASGALGVTRGPVPAIPRGTGDRVTPPRLTSDERGQFTLPGLLPGRYELRAWHPEHARSEVVEVEVRAATPAQVRLVLGVGWPLRGRVLGSNDRPLEGAWVELDDGQRLRTDARGLFEAGRRRGTVTMVARAEGYAPAERRVVMRPGGVEVDVRLAPARSRLEGQVVDANAQPLEGVQVTVQGVDGLTATEVRWTDIRGAWAVEGLPAGRYEVEASRAEMPTARREVGVEADAVAEVDLRLVAGWFVEVTVLEWGRDVPIAGAWVDSGKDRVRTEEDGRARLGPFEGATVSLEVAATGFPTRAVVVERPPGGEAAARVLLERGGALEGTVTDYRGDPVGGAEVWLADAETDAVLGRGRSDARGRFAFAGLPEGDVVVHAVPPAGRVEELAESALPSDVLRDRVTREVVLRLGRR